MSNLIYSQSADQSKAINDLRGSAIVKSQSVSRKRSTRGQGFPRQRPDTRSALTFSLVQTTHEIRGRRSIPRTMISDSLLACIAARAKSDRGAIRDTPVGSTLGISSPGDFLRGEDLYSLSRGRAPRLLRFGGYLRFGCRLSPARHRSRCSRMVHVPKWYRGTSGRECRLG